jgi:putative ABC transport system permease protein
MKNFFRPLKSVWIGLTTHKLRSFLTMLGIIIGVASVIALMSIGKGTTQNILSNIESLGSNLVTISAGATIGFGGVRGGTSSSGGALTEDDAKAISQQVTNVSSVAPVSTSGLQLIAGTENTFAQVIGTTGDYQVMNNLIIASGNFFTEQQYQRGASVVVLGFNVASTLFPDTSVSPIGQKIRLSTKAIVTVIGVLESKGGSFNSVDDNVIIPLTLMQRSISQSINAQGQKIVSTIVLALTDTNQSDQTVTDITSLLRERHKLSDTADDDFSIQSMTELISNLESTSNNLTLLLGAIAAIALLVGGIGVMNIMLVSVLERTREIGIRKALGARNRDIWIQFLLEAGFLTFAGGIIGVAIGWGVSYIINKYNILSLTTLVTPDIVVMAVSVAIGIGLFFGFYPAWNASRLDPIQALRSE